MQEILINGVTCEIQRSGRVVHGYESFWSYGIALNGRKVRVAQHSLPPHVLDNGGTVYTGGNTYEVPRHA